MAESVIPHLIVAKDQMNDSQRRVAEYIIEDPARALGQTSKELSESTGVSEAGIVRFCQKLGYTGYRDFRIRLAQNQGAEAASIVPEGIKKSDDSMTVAKKVLQIESEDIRYTAEMVDAEAMDKVLRMISECGKLAFFGVGSSALVASTAKEHFLQYGKAAFAEAEGLSQIVLANTLGPGDVAFGISISGTSKITVQSLRVAHEKGAGTISMTQNVSSPLAQLSDLVIPIYKKDHSIDDLGTATRIVHLAMIDAIAIAYASEKWDNTTRIANENRENFRDYLYGA